MLLRVWLQFWHNNATSDTTMLFYPLLDDWHHFLAVVLYLMLKYDPAERSQCIKRGFMTLNISVVCLDLFSTAVCYFQFCWVFHTFDLFLFNRKNFNLSVWFLYVLCIPRTNCKRRKLIGQNKVKICELQSQSFRFSSQKIGCPIYDKRYIWETINAQKQTRCEKFLFFMNTKWFEQEVQMQCVFANSVAKT